MKREIDESQRKFKNKIRIVRFVMTIAVVFGACTATTVMTSAYPYTPETSDREVELRLQGYTAEQVYDQCCEEFDKVDGGCGTGGIDGKLLDGSEAPNDANGNPKPSAPTSGTTPSGNTGNSETGSSGNTNTGSGDGTSGSTGETNTEQKPVHTHAWNEKITKNPTCVENGEKTFICSCGKTKTESIAKVDHNYQLTKTDNGTCVKVGYEEYTCATCGDSYLVEKEYGEHIYTLSEEGKKPTCTEDGVKYTLCAVCGDKVGEILPKTGHNIDTNATVDKIATCTENGVQSYRCKTCGTVDREDIIAATGHIKGDVLNITKEATGFNTGEGNYLCTKCEEVLETVEIPALYEIKDIAIPIAVCIIAVIAVCITVIITLRRKRSK